MDIISHGLWAGIGTKIANRKNKSLKLSFKLAFFWGMFPDLFAFTFPFLRMVWNYAIRGSTFTDLRHHYGAQPPWWATDHYPILGIASYLYNLSHSLIIFGIVFITVALLNHMNLKRAPWEMIGWFLHIISDIPTHTANFFTTPFLWPISSYRFVHGFSWATDWFMILNYSLLLGFYVFFRPKKSRS